MYSAFSLRSPCAAASDTSTCTPTATSVPPISAAAACALSSDRSAITTQAPSAASFSAVALPMPEAAPVTRATRVARGFGFGIRWSLASSSAQYSMRKFSASSMGAYVESPSAPRITLIALM